MTIVIGFLNIISLGALIVSGGYHRFCTELLTRMTHRQYFQTLKVLVPVTVADIFTHYQRHICNITVDASDEVQIA